MLEHTSATTIGGFRSQPERCNNACLLYKLGQCPAWNLLKYAHCRVVSENANGAESSNPADE